MSIESGMPSNQLILCHPLLLPSVFSSIRVFSDEQVLHIMWPKYWNFSFSITSSIEYSGLISFRIYWFNLLAVQGTLRSLFQHHSLKASIFWHSAWFMVQLSHSYMTTGKTVTLTRSTFITKVMSLLFNMLSSFYFKDQESFNFMAAVTIQSDFGGQGNKICHCFYFFPIYLPGSNGTGCHGLSGFCLFEEVLGFWGTRSKCRMVHSVYCSHSECNLVPPCYLWREKKKRATTQMLAAQKKSYNKPRQCIKKQRHYFANKGLYGQSYGFSSSHVWMWELDCKEGWLPKNWCF